MSGAALSGTQSVTITSGDSSGGVIQSWRTTGTWTGTPAWASGADTTSNTSYSAAGTIAVTAGDVVTIGTGLPTDTATSTVQAVTGAGATFDVISETVDTGTTLGNDSLLTVCHLAVATGSASSLTYTATLAAAAQGVSGFVRLRHTPPDIPPELTMAPRHS